MRCNLKKYIRTHCLELCLGLPLVLGVYLCIAYFLPFQPQYENNTLLLLHDMHLHHSKFFPSFLGVTLNNLPPLYFFILSFFHLHSVQHLFLLRCVSLGFMGGALITLYGISHYFFNQTVARLIGIIFASSIAFAVSAVLVTPTGLSFFSAVLFFSALLWCLFTKKMLTVFQQCLFAFINFFFILSLGFYWFLLIYIAVFLWAASIDYLRVFKKLFALWGSLLFLVCFLSYLIFTSAHCPHFLFDYFIFPLTQGFLSFKANNFIPNWPNFLFALIAFLPWLVFLLGALRYNAPLAWKDRKSEPFGLFLLLLLAVLLFALLATAFLTFNALIVTMVCSILLGRYIAPGFEVAKLPLKQYAYDIFLLLAIVVLTFAAIRLVGFIKAQQFLQHRFLLFLWLYGLLISVIILPILRFATLKTTVLSLSSLTLFSFLFLGLSMHFFLPTQQLLWQKNMQSVLQTPVIIGAYHQYPAQDALSIKKPIIFISPKTYPLSSIGNNSIAFQHSAWQMTEKQFWHLVITQKKPYYLFIPTKEFLFFLHQHQDIKILGYNKQFILVTQEKSPV